MARSPKYGLPSGRIERCTKCPGLHNVDQLGRLPEHQTISLEWNDRSRTRAPVTEPCRGFGTLSQEERARRRVDRTLANTAAMDAQVPAAREEAAIVLDAFLSFRDVITEAVGDQPRISVTERLPDLERVARHLLGLVPTPPVPWRWEPQIVNRLGHRSRFGDVYCLFCGERILTGVTLSAVRNREEPPVEELSLLIAAPMPRWTPFDRHLTTCMLLILAGMRRPVLRGVKSLPDDLRPDPDA